MTFGLGFGFPRGQSSGAAPTLSYNFVGATALPASLTFTRTSNATQFDSLGRLVWAPANLLTNTDTFGLGFSPSGVSFVASTEVPPVGLPKKFEETDGLTNLHAGNITITAVAGATYRLSAYIKRAERDFALMALAGAFTTTSVQIDLVNGVVTTGTGAPIGADIQDAGNGWWRVSFAATANTSGTGAYGIIYVSSDGVWNNRVYTGVGGYGVVYAAPMLHLESVTALPNPYIASGASPYYGPRFDYDPATLSSLGLLVEEARTNSCINSATVGGVAPSTAPTGWFTTTVTGITITYAYGTELGIPYIDVTYSGTNTTGAAAFPTIFPSAIAGAIAASNGQTWASSLFVRKIAGVNDITGWQHNIRGRASGALVAGQNSSAALVDAASLPVGRSFRTFTFTDATITTVEHVVSRSMNIGESIDITLRIGGPQLELAGFSTSLIPTFGAAATRAAETCVSNISGVVANGVGTLTASYSCRAVAAATFQTAVSLSQTSNDRVTIYEFGSAVTGEIRAAGVVNASPTVTAPGAFVQRRAAFGYTTSSANFAVNGVLGTLATTAVPPTGLVYLTYGATANNPVVGQVWVQKTTYYPTQLPNAQLQALTT